MALTETYLELAPEFGGTRFGPFKGMEIRLGSDPGSNDIVLPENLGVLPQHLKLISQGDGSFIVAPVERTAGVFTFRSGGSAKQVTSPIAIQGGSDTYSADSFSVVTPEGPRFYVLQVMEKPQAKEQSSQFDQARKRLSGKSLWAELKRQGLVMFLTTKGGQQFQRWGTFIKTGAILRPRYLIGGAAVVAGWLFAGGVGLVACQAAVGQAKKEDELEQCKNEVIILGGDVNQGPTLESYTARVLGKPTSPNNKWKTALKQDTNFAEAYRKQLAAIYRNENRRQRLKWVYKKPGSDFVKVKQAMESNGWPEELVRVFAYTAAIEGTGADRRWTYLESDGYGEEVCARGPMAVTWRQAKQLGVTNVSADAAMAYNDYGVASQDDKVAKLKESVSKLRNYPPPDDFPEIANYSADNDQNTVCIAGEPQGEATEDPRDGENIKEFISQISSKVGPSASKLPSMEASVGAMTRLLKYYAADYRGEFSKVELGGSDGMPTIALDSTKKIKPYAIDKAAETLAKAVAIPCLAALDPELADLPIPNTIGEAPAPLDCIIIEGMIKYDVR